MMRQPMIQRSRQGLRRALSDFVGAPVGGWNARDSLDAMGKRDAVVLENWFPRQTDLELRGGWEAHQSGYSSDVAQTLMTWNGAQSSKLFACTNAGIFDASAGGARGSALTALTNGLVSSVNFVAAGGHYMIAVNGTDTLKRFDGTSWSSVTGTGTLPITGVSTEELSSVAAAHKRLWFTRKFSSSVYYLDVGAVGGALTEFPLGQVFPAGGVVVAIDTWSSDAGDGADDYTVFVSSEGELAVYRGSDPTTADGFSKVGVFKVAKPIGGFRCLAKYGGDLAYLCELGLYPVSKLLSARDFVGLALTDKIDEAFNTAVKTYRNNPGWQTVIFPQEQALIVNIPITSSYNEQFVMNMLTGAWTRFIGWDVTSMAIFGTQLYGAGRLVIQKLWSGVSDDGALIRGRGQMAYNYFGKRGLLKQIKLLAAVLRASGAFSRSLAIDVDYRFAQRLQGQLGTDSAASAVWDTAVWDTAEWAGDFELYQAWASIKAPEGYAHSLFLEVLSAGAGVKWLGFNLSGEYGGNF